MKKQNKYYIYYCIVISLVLVVTTIYRAATTSITYDEAFTYFYYVVSNPLDVFSHMFKEGTLANNHVINSFLISVFSMLFKTKFSEFIIRLPNIIFYIVYLFFGYKICKNYKYKYSAFSLLALNYGANEFFGLGRGYGMSSALVLGGLYFFKEYLNNDKNVSLNLSYLFLLLSSFANSASLIAYATIILLSFIQLIKKKNLINYIKKNIMLIPIILLTLVIVFYHFHISKAGLPLAGGKTGFYNDVIKSMTYVYGFPDMVVDKVSNLVILLLGCILSRKYNKKDNNLIRFSGVLFCIVLIIVTKASGKLWLTGRSLIPSMPLIIVSIIEVIELLKIKKSTIFQIIIIILLIIPFANNYTVKYTREWDDNYPIKGICYDALENKDNTETLKIRNHVSTQFYREKILLENNYDIFGE